MLSRRALTDEASSAGALPLEASGAAAASDIVQDKQRKEKGSSAREGAGLLVESLATAVAMLVVTAGSGVSGNERSS